MANKIRPYHMDLAIAAAATVAMHSMTKAANRHTATARIQSTSILPAFGISWGRNVINAVTSDWANKLLPKLRYSPLPRLHYDNLAAMFKTAYPNPYSVIPEWGEWKQLADAYMLDRRFLLKSIAQTIALLSYRGIPDPGALSVLDARAAETMATAAPDAGPMRTIWRLSRTAAAAVASNEHLAVPESGLPADSFKRAAKRCIWSMGRTRPINPLIRLNLHAPPSFGENGPIATDRSVEEAEDIPLQGEPLHQGTHAAKYDETNSRLPPFGC